MGLIEAEAIMDASLSHDSAHAAAVGGKDENLVHPWGAIPLNRDAHPDVESELGSTSRDGEVGDSGMPGTVASHGRRSSAILEQSHPTYEHLSVGGAGRTISVEAIGDVVGPKRDHRLDLETGTATRAEKAP